MRSLVLLLFLVLLPWEQGLPPVHWAPLLLQQLH